MGHFNHVLSYKKMKEMWEEEDRLALEQAKQRKLDFLYKEALERGKAEKEKFARTIPRQVGDIENPKALEIAQEYIDQDAILAGYPKVKLHIDNEGFVVDEDGGYFCYEEVYVKGRCETTHITVCKENFANKIHGRNSTFIRKRYKVVV